MKLKRRKKEFIDPEVQGALTRRLILHWVVFVGIAAVLAFAIKWLSDPLLSISQHWSEAWYTYGPILMVLACLAPIFIYDAVKLSNRFTGPVYRLRQATKQMAAGELPDVVEFRGADFWKDLAGDFNVIIKRLGDNDTKPESNETIAS